QSSAVSRCTRIRSWHGNHVSIFLGLTQIWDTGGQERFRALVSSFFKGSDGCMLAFDVTDTDSFYALEDWRQEILSQTRPGPQQFPFVVLGNKIDLTSRQVSRGGCEAVNLVLLGMRLTLVSPPPSPGARVPHSH
uniref:Uncharacterized protein n=1 Tax=Callorhinchus milii TaxID=7868 RepID=A0A4W3GJD7_CALMI